MRDPKRITEFLSVIQQLWERQPDSRFNQLVHNLQVDYYNETGNGIRKECFQKHHELPLLESNGYYYDLFHVEDDEFLGWLKKQV